MNLRSIKDLQLKGKKVIVRTNYDVPLKKSDRPVSTSEAASPCHNTEGQCCGKCHDQTQYEIEDSSRIDESLPTIKYLLDQGAQVTIISHLGRPEGQVVPELSLAPIAEYLSKLLPEAKKCQMRENLRFEPGEEANELEYARKLADGQDYFVNDAFACAHREHASVVGLAKLLPSAFGFDFLEEVDNLNRVLDQPARPSVVILGGKKFEKLDVIDKLKDRVDYLLVGGLLPGKITPGQAQLAKLVVAELDESGKDITEKSRNEFIDIIVKAKTIVWAGPMGLYEDNQHAQGTKQIAEAVTSSGAFTIIGGGDTEAALSYFGLGQKVSYISSGGGAMLEYLAKGTLPGIEAIGKEAWLK